MAQKIFSEKKSLIFDFGGSFWALTLYHSSGQWLSVKMDKIVDPN